MPGGGSRSRTKRRWRAAREDRGAAPSPVSATQRPAGGSISGAVLAGEIATRFATLDDCRIEVARTKQVTAGGRSSRTRWCCAGRSSPTAHAGTTSVVATAPVDIGSWTASRRPMQRWTFTAPRGGPVQVERTFSFRHASPRPNRAPRRERVEATSVSLTSGQVQIELAVAEDVVEAADRRPELARARTRAAGRRRARASRGGSTRRRAARSAVCGAFLSRLSSRGCVPRLDLGDLLADRDHRVAEAIELGLRLALGRLDHQRARRPGTTSSARGSRSPSGAWRRRRPRCRPAS